MATVDEFPSLSWLDEDPSQAIAGLASLVEDVERDEDADDRAEHDPADSIPFKQAMAEGLMD